MKSKSLISLILCFALVLTSFTFAAIVPAGAADTAKADTSANVTVAETGNSNTGELVLKTWNWPLSVIQSNLDAIADAGFTVIETSAVNGIVGSGNSVTNWYQFYQPTNYNIGNKIGTEEQFKTLCSSANAKGIKIIVDVVLNHTTDQISMVDSSLQHWHSSTNNLQGDDYNDRYKVTQWRQSGMPDLDTSRSDIQSAANTFLKRMISDGASGFRFDAAKHIELPSKYDGQYGCASDYWPNALNGVNASFMYGEVLGGTNANEYMNYMKITNSGYSGGVRSAIQNYELPASTVTNNDYGADPDFLVDFVETHDNFVDGNYGMSNFQLQLAYAAMAAQGNNCMYLARPKDSTPNYTSGGSGYAGTNDANDGGDGAYLLPQVAEVNKFHNAMSGKASYVTNINNNNQVLAVRRGTDGICIINAGASDITFSGVYTGMPNGTYKDKINNTSFTVSGGYMSGTVGSGKIYPIYNASSSSDVQLSDCMLHGWINGADYYGDSYKFNSSGSLTTTFTQDSYVYINANGTNYNTAQYVDGTSASFFTGNSEKMKVPAGTVTFTLTKSGTGFNLSYTTASQPTTEPTSPTQPSGGTMSSAIYLNVPSDYEADSPDWYIWTWGSKDGRSVKGVKDSTSGYYKFDDHDTNVIFLRMKSATSFSWDNEWNRVETTVPSNKNVYTITGWTLDGKWEDTTVTEPTQATEPPTYDYTVKYNYNVDGAAKTITRTVSDSTLTDASEIAALKDPSSIITSPAYAYSLGSATKSGTTITATLNKTAKQYTVYYNGTALSKKYGYLETATVTSTTETNFLLDGSFVKRGKEFTTYVTGNVYITTDNSSSQKDVADIDKMGAYFSDNQVSFELLATANVSSFERMGVAFARTDRNKTKTDIANAVKNVATGTSVDNKIAVHNSNVDWANDSGLYQFIYAPYLNNAPSSGAELDFYAFAVTKDGTVIVSDAKPISVTNAIA